MCRNTKAGAPPLAVERILPSSSCLHHHRCLKPPPTTTAPQQSLRPARTLQDIAEALRRLPDDVVLARNARLKRVMDLSMKHEHLPKELQEKQTPFQHYLLVSSRGSSSRLAAFVKRRPGLAPWHTGLLCDQPDQSSAGRAAGVRGRCASLRSCTCPPGRRVCHADQSDTTMRTSCCRALSTR
jgi:hypothetical protein